MDTFEFGRGIAEDAAITPACTAAIFDESGDKVLLVRRADSGQWKLPGGHVEAGESVAECCQRVVREGTGLAVRVTRLIGIYTTPDRIKIAADGTRCQIIAMHFRCTVSGGTLRLNDEYSDVGFFTLAEIARMDLIKHHNERIAETLAARTETFIH